MSEKNTASPQNTGNMNNKQAMSALQQNGGTIVSVIAIALAGFFGWNYFQNHQTVTVDMVASDKFANIQTLNQQVAMSTSVPELAEANKAELDKQRQLLDTQIEGLVSNHGDSIYAWQAMMLKARNQMDASDYSSASETLKIASEINLDDAGLQAITQLRYAQALLANNDVNQALQVANREIPGNFEGSQQELLGDIYLAKGDQQSAIRSYNNAWELLAERQEHRGVLALKMESLGIQVKPIEKESFIAKQTSIDTKATTSQLTDTATEQSTEQSSDEETHSQSTTEQTAEDKSTSVDE